MFSPAIRLALIAAALAAWALAFAASSWISVAFLAGAIFLGIGHVRNGPIWLAHRNLKAGRVERARELLESVRWPKLLDSQSRGVYEAMRGDLASADGDPVSAEARFRAALAENLRTDDNRCGVRCGLAAALLAQGRTGPALQALEEAARFPHRPELEARLQALREKAG